MCLRVKDRFKGRRTKYYVLKAYASTAEVILKLLENALAQRRQVGAKERQTKILASAAAAKEDKKKERMSRMTQMPPKAGSGESHTSTPTGTQRASGTAEEAAVMVEDPDALEKIAQEWLDRLAEFGRIYSVAKPRALLLHGQFLETMGSGSAKQKQAHAAFKTSLDVARKNKMPYDEALALYELGKHAEAHQNRMNNLKRAQDLFEQCGAMYDFERCRQQLQRAERSKSGSAGSAGHPNGNGGKQQQTAFGDLDDTFNEHPAGDSDGNREVDDAEALSLNRFGDVAIAARKQSLMQQANLGAEGGGALGAILEADGSGARAGAPAPAPAPSVSIGSTSLKDLRGSEWPLAERSTGSSAASFMPGAAPRPRTTDGMAHPKLTSAEEEEQLGVSGCPPPTAASSTAASAATAAAAPAPAADAFAYASGGARGSENAGKAVPPRLRNGGSSGGSKPQLSTLDVDRAASGAAKPRSFSDPKNSEGCGMGCGTEPRTSPSEGPTVAASARTLSTQSDTRVNLAAPASSERSSRDAAKLGFRPVKPADLGTHPLQRQDLSPITDEAVIC